MFLCYLLYNCSQKLNTALSCYREVHPLVLLYYRGAKLCFVREVLWTKINTHRNLYLNLFIKNQLMSWELITVAVVALMYNVNRTTNPHNFWQDHKFHYSRATLCSKRDYRLVSDPNLWCVCVCMYIMKRVWEELYSTYTHTFYLFGTYFNISLNGNAGWILYIHKHTHTHACMYLLFILILV